MNSSTEGGVLIFGGTRGTGLEVAKILVEAGDSPTSVIRPSSDSSALEAAGVATVAGDAMEPDSVDKAFDSGSYRAVVISLGGKRGEPRRPDFEGA